MISATLISPLLGTPCGQADAWVLPSAMFTSVMISLMATLDVPLQSPTHGTGVGEGVAVGLGVTV